jgi:tetratricopeptide (TPR) repeat protein
VARPAIDEVEGLDEEFLFHLGRGSDLLGKGEVEGARASLERALQLRPKDAKALGLLGQALFKLGRFEQASQIYARLVDDNPAEPAARVNLGLANLKAQRYPEAARQLEIALDLNPDHKRAMGYLGLALFEMGEPAKAREWFTRAGSDQMIARCDEALASRTAGRSAAAAAGAPELRDAPPEPLPALGGSGEGAPTPDGVPLLGAWSSARVVRAPAAPFAVTGSTLAVAVRGAVLARADGLFALRGAVKLEPEVKRFRGRATDQPFGEGARRMHRASGDGALLYRADGRRFLALDLGTDAGYFQEGAVFAFEESVVFENGRVPSRGGSDLHLVHLRGPGRFLLATGADPVALEVGAQAPARVPLAALVGWTGALTPRLATLRDGGADAADAGPVVVELSGEGRVLVDPSAGLGGGAA